MRSLMILSLMCLALTAQAVDDFTEEQRLQGFAEQQRRNAAFAKERESGSSEIFKARKAWDKELSESVGEYKAWKARQNKALDESSPEYAADKALKRKVARDLEDYRTEYIKEKNKKLRSQNNNIRLTEEHEYGLDEPVVRTDYKKRMLYGAKSPWSQAKSRGQGSSSPAPNLGGDYTPPPPPVDFGAPPPPSGPEFYEPDIPPPPPPDPGSFDEPIPPPIFDDPDF